MVPLSPTAYTRLDASPNTLRRNPGFAFGITVQTPPTRRRIVPASPTTNTPSGSLGLAQIARRSLGDGDGTCRQPDPSLVKMVPLSPTATKAPSLVRVIP